MCLYQKFISTFTDTLIIAPDCFLVFWFSIKGNQVYNTWITYTPALLVSFQLLFSHCVKYVEARAFCDPYLPVCGQNRIRIFQYLDCPNTGKCGYDSVHMRENRDQRKPGFRHISRSILLKFSVITSTYAKI